VEKIVAFSYINATRWNGAAAWESFQNPDITE
jgi:hypothetical protein